MIYCKNCGTPIGSVSYCPACGATQDYPSPEQIDPSDQPRPIWETDLKHENPDEERQTEPIQPAVVVVPSRSPSGTKYDMGGVKFGESSPPITNSSNYDESDVVSQTAPTEEQNISQFRSTESVFREELRQVSSKLPRSNSRANPHARKVEGAGIQRAIAIVSLIVGAMSFPYGIALVVIAWISLRKVQSAIYAGTDEEVTSNMRTAKTLNIIALCILAVTVGIGLFFAVGILANVGVLNFGS